MIFLAKNIRQGPVAQAVYITQLALAVEDFLRPFAAEAEGFGERTEKLNDLRNVIIVFAIFGTRLWIKEIVASNEFENLRLISIAGERRRHLQHTMLAILQTSVLAPHLAPRMTSGDLYCLVWMSLVKWWFTQHALPRSAILTLMMLTSHALSSALRLSPVEAVEVLDLSREIPDTSLDSTSLEMSVSQLRRPVVRHLRALLPSLLGVIWRLRRRLFRLVLTQHASQACLRT